MTLFAAILAIVAASLFAVQTDDRAAGFHVSRGEAFYVQVSGHTGPHGATGRR